MYYTEENNLSTLLVRSIQEYYTGGLQSAVVHIQYVEANDEITTEKKSDENCHKEN